MTSTIHGMNKTVYFTAAIAAVLVLAGCSTAASDEPQGIQPFVATEETSATPRPEAEATVYYYAGVPTGPGEVCDIESLYTVDCHKKYPDVAYLNGITRNAGEPLLSLSDEEKIELGHQACDQVASGVDREAVALIEGSGANFTNNTAVVGVAIPSYCPEFDTSGLFD